MDPKETLLVLCKCGTFSVVFAISKPKYLCTLMPPFTAVRIRMKLRLTYKVKFL